MRAAPLARLMVPPHISDYLHVCIMCTYYNTATATAVAAAAATTPCISWEQKKPPLPPPLPNCLVQAVRTISWQVAVEPTARAGATGGCRFSLQNAGSIGAVSFEMSPEEEQTVRLFEDQQFMGAENKWLAKMRYWPTLRRRHSLNK